MKGSCKKAIVAASAALASLGALRISSATTLIENNESAQVDGWNITAPTGVSLTVTTSGNEIFVEKAANFQSPNAGFLVTFQPVSGASTPATSIDFTDEALQNNTGTTWSGFQFILMNLGSVNATFPSVSNVFAPPSGTGYSYTTVSLNSSGDILSYTGTQANGTTSNWGSSAAGDNLLIDAPSGADFAFKELPNGGGTPPPNGVPLPAAAWQSIATLGILGAFGVARRMKRSLA